MGTWESDELPVSPLWSGQLRIELEPSGIGCTVKCHLTSHSPASFLDPVSLGGLEVEQGLGWDNGVPGQITPNRAQSHPFHVSWAPSEDLPSSPGILGQEPWRWPCLQAVTGKARTGPPVCQPALHCVDPSAAPVVGTQSGMSPSAPHSPSLCRLTPTRHQHLSLCNRFVERLHSRCLL